ncbi:sensor histidine kinase [Thermophagus sp. OGC60D27]|uniref:sensor histidine kinase n=1 Tax=Thermophagus sp. OGC60D27 TaxID=3458415 RepID=UPI004037761B
MTSHEQPITKNEREPIPEEFKKPEKSIIDKGFRPALWRFLIISLIGFLVIAFVFLMFGDKKQDPLRTPFPFFLSILVFNLASEGNIVINRYLDKKAPWFFSISRRAKRQLILSFIWTFCLVIFSFIVLPNHIYEEPFFRQSALLTIIFGFLFVLIFNSSLFIKSFLLNWRKSILEVEALKQSKLKSDYRVLQNQLNPHFLFNSFSTLISEIHYNPAQAIEFTQKLAEVYRYVLQKRNDITVPLQEELQFLYDFIFLHKKRMGNTLVVRTDIPEHYLDFHIPPLSLQLLLENAIKHNRASEKSPLTIHIEISNGKWLKTCNNLQPKRSVSSTGTGLDNIAQRYKLLTGEDIIVEKTENHYCIKLPLLFDAE